MSTPIFALAFPFQIKMASLHERAAAGDLEGLKETLIGLDDDSEGINARLVFHMCGTQPATFF